MKPYRRSRRQRVAEFRMSADETPQEFWLGPRDPRGFITNFNIEDLPILDEAAKLTGLTIVFGKPVGHSTRGMLGLYVYEHNYDLTEFWDIVKELMDNQKRLNPLRCPNCYKIKFWRF